MSHEAWQDPLFEAVKQLVIETRIPSVAHVQVTFRIGYSRAASMLEAMEGDVVTPKDERGMRRMLTGETREMGSLNDFVNECIRVFDLICDAGYYHVDKEAPYRKSKANPSMLFDNFVIGKANQLAVSAATQVAEAQNVSHNPLFIYGGVGIGKSHLIQAIANQLCINRPQARVCYLHAERFVSDVVRAYQTNKFEEFEQYYRSLDVLLIDDVQFFSGKSKTQEQFFDIFNALVDSHKQIILASDTTPSGMTGIEPRLISRFGGGLTVSIEPPDLETRVSILLLKSGDYKIPIGEEMATFIAEQVTSDIREMKGALGRVHAYAKFHNLHVTIDLAKEALKDLISAQ
ncbi:MAG: DnaA/Hda family protein [Gallionellaceae bacterium]|nr:DnaA/Hda family protein [Gallionellaceae bacterium]